MHQSFTQQAFGEDGRTTLEFSVSGHTIDGPETTSLSAFMVLAGLATSDFSSTDQTGSGFIFAIRNTSETVPVFSKVAFVDGSISNQQQLSGLGLPPEGALWAVTLNSDLTAEIKVDGAVVAQKSSPMPDKTYYGLFGVQQSQAEITATIQNG